MHSHTRFFAACLAMALSIACIVASLHDDTSSRENRAGSPTETASSLQNQAM